MKRCEGMCAFDDECTGDVTRVTVSGHKLPPTEFNYCETARELDFRNGFTVEETK